MTGTSAARRRFIETDRRVALLAAAWGSGPVETVAAGLPVTHPLLVEALHARLHALHVAPSRVRYFSDGACVAARWAHTRDGNPEVCARFAVDLVFATRAMTALAEVAAPIDRVTTSVIDEVVGGVECTLEPWALNRGARVSVPSFCERDRHSLRQLVATDATAVVTHNAIVGRWKPTVRDPHLYGADPLCPPAEALAVAAAWFACPDHPHGHPGPSGAHRPPARVVVLGCGPFAGPVMLGTMMPGAEIVVDGFPFTDGPTPVCSDPCGVVVNLASDSMLRLAAELVGHRGDVPTFRKVFDAAKRQVDGFGDGCVQLLARLQVLRHAGRPVFVMGGPVTHGLFAQLATDLGLLPVKLFGHDATTYSVFVQNPPGRSARGIPHLPGVVVSLWRWS